MMRYSPTYISQAKKWRNCSIQRVDKNAGKKEALLVGEQIDTPIQNVLWQNSLTSGRRIPEDSKSHSWVFAPKHLTGSQDTCMRMFVEVGQSNCPSLEGWISGKRMPSVEYQAALRGSAIMIYTTTQKNLKNTVLSKKQNKTKRKQ